MVSRGKIERERESLRKRRDKDKEKDRDREWRERGVEENRRDDVIGRHEESERETDG